MILLVPYSQDPLVAAARQIIDHYKEQLPDLSTCRILVADTQCAAALRAALLNEAGLRGFSAILGPHIDRLDSWLRQYGNTDQEILQRPAQELILGEALRAARELYANTDPWMLADQLLALFEELTLSQLPVPDTLEDFEQSLQLAYGLPRPSAAMQQEAYILHTLWHAWRKQLEDENCSDPASAYLTCLHASQQGSLPEELWLMGFTGFLPAEIHWLKASQKSGRTHLLLHGSARHPGNHPDGPLQRIMTELETEAGQLAQADAPADAFSAFFESLHSPEGGHLSQRAQLFAQQFPDDPIAPRLRTLCTENPEMEAQAVALQVRRWLLDNRQPIAIVSEDRRLARRVRAMLEASGIQLDDPAGWALSTTSAAAIVERWLETVEEDFACGPMLDVLKSPFVSGAEQDQHLALVLRLEQDVVLHENIARGLERYRRHLDLRSKRLPGHWTEHTRRELHSLLNRLDHAAAPLAPLLNGRHSARLCVDAIRDSLLELGVWQPLEADAAGQTVIQVLEQLATAAAAFETELNWQELRTWLGRSLERATFRVPGGKTAVKLLSLEQTRLQRFAGIVVAGCSRDHLPGSPPGQAFFNQRVRAQLGLPNWSELLTSRLHHFVRVLHSADNLLLTRHAEVDGEPVPASPWLELLETFHANAYGGSLHDDELNTLLDQAGTRPVSPDSAPLPEPEQRSKAVVPAGRQPHTWSTATHQRLIDCPYRFFAADALHLKPQEEISEALSKADYGSLVHRILQAFHSNVRKLSGPWTGPLGKAQQKPAIELLERISREVFDKAIEDDFEARGWLQQWLACIPSYVKWQTTRQQDWQVEEVEVDAEQHFEKLRLKGRIDRIDKHQSQLGIVDYKTGVPPSSADVLSGEAVQLPSYALMLQQTVGRLDYVQIGKSEVKSVSHIEGEDLQSLITATGSRLGDLQQALQCDEPLPAWGDDHTCKWCEYAGVCRRDMWQEREPADE